MCLNSILFFNTGFKMAPKSAKYLEAIELLPKELIPVFDQLLEQYKYAALKVHGRSFFSPLVIAELVLMGWRDAADIIPPIKKD
jgi:hypothetical protein